MPTFINWYSNLRFSIFKYISGVKNGSHYTTGYLKIYKYLKFISTQLFLNIISCNILYIFTMFVFFTKKQQRKTETTPPYA